VKLIAHKLIGIYLCASLRSALIVSFVRVHWQGFKCDCRALWSVKPQGRNVPKPGPWPPPP
jgi:hypothetical protein